MDIATFIFVALLCLVALLLTVSVRREFLTQERLRREQDRQSRQTHPRHKP